MMAPNVMQKFESATQAQRKIDFCFSPISTAHIVLVIKFNI